MEKFDTMVSLPINKEVSRAAAVLAAEIGISRAELMRRALAYFVNHLASQPSGPEMAKKLQARLVENHRV